MEFPSGDEAVEVVHPGEEPLDFRPSAITAELAAVLGFSFASAPVGRICPERFASECQLVEEVLAGSFLDELPARLNWGPELLAFLPPVTLFPRGGQSISMWRTTAGPGVGCDHHDDADLRWKHGLELTSKPL